MRGGLAVAFAFAAGAALAQNAPVVIPPAPPVTATPIAPPAILAPPPGSPPPGLTPTPMPPAAANPPPDGTAPIPGTDIAPDDTGPPPNDDSGLPPATPPGAATPPPADSWLPGATAELRVLNQVDGSVAQVQIPVGGAARIGDMQVSVQSCLRRPPDQIPDAAVFLSAVPATQPDAAATASDPDAPPADPVNGGIPAASAGQPDLAGGYRGWLLRSAPGAAMAGDASESLSIIDCR